MPAEPREAVLPPEWASRRAVEQQRIRQEGFDLGTLPGYERGKPPMVETWHQMPHTEVYPQIYGREFGANGIGRLREVALVEITESERFETYGQDPEFFPQLALPYLELDVSRMQEQSQEYEEALVAHDVVVHRIRYPDPPIGAFGPIRSTWAANELLVVRGGSIVEKIAINPMGFGRAEYLALWCSQYLSIPTLATISGTGVAEAGPCFWLSEDVFVAARGLAFNDDGLQQLLPVVERSAVVDETTALVIGCSGERYFDPATGSSHHPDMLLGPLDVDKVIAYLPGLDFETIRWLRDHEYTIVEVDTEEQVKFAPANVTILEPGVVVMHREAQRAVAAVRKAGVEVIEVPYSEFLRAGGGLHCSTLRLWRDEGPVSRWRS